MSGDTVGTAMDALFMLGGGLGFARLGWGGLKPRAAQTARASEDAAAVTAPQPARSTGWQVFAILLLLFGGFIALCGLMLGLSLILPE